MRLVLAVPIMLLAGLGASRAQTDLPKSHSCFIRGGGFAEAGGAAPGTNTITMTNDGGWCGHITKTVLGSIVVGAPMHVVRQPTHGQVSITVLRTGTNVYYKPDPGYSGPDSFSVWHDMYNLERPYKVIVK
jgi:hypothetical protein